MCLYRNIHPATPFDLAFCAEKGNSKKVYEKTKEIYDNPIVNEIAGKFKEHYIGNILTKLNPILAKLYKGINATPVGITLGIMESQELDTWATAYNNEARKLGDDVKKLKVLFGEYDRGKKNMKNCYCRAPNIVADEIQALKNHMAESFKSINISYSGILTEREINSKSCDKAFTVYHKWFCYYYLQIANINID